MNKTLSVFTAAIVGLIASPRLGVALHTLPILPAATVSCLAASVGGLTFALGSRIQKPSPAEDEAPRLPVLATGSIWGIGV